MESVVEDVEDERQTEGSPANSHRCKKLVGFDGMRHTRGVEQSYVVFCSRSQFDDDIDS